jgi:hypothetical protein
VSQVNEGRERRLIVAWKSDASKGILPVAELIIRIVEPRYRFGYLEGAREALCCGFQPFLRSEPRGEVRSGLFRSSPTAFCQRRPTTSVRLLLA